MLCTNSLVLRARQTDHGCGRDGIRRASRSVTHRYVTERYMTPSRNNLRKYALALTGLGRRRLEVAARQLGILLDLQQQRRTSAPLGP
ncbi:hypothetical protein EVAR_58930_1 [Eumeta japonica]|uniref:Uncharacterized protein n=1 Tax=Eumeta variegata TaxID=151549 RepID=A0A4C1Y963_EUMVA|nr:hypothetical protein EVAR_58930_1 [Eumeta japonica]